MKNFIKKYWIYLPFIVAGMIGGYLYWYYVGCKTGKCPITSVWYNTSIYGAFIGYIAGDLAKSIVKKLSKPDNSKRIN